MSNLPKLKLVPALLALVALLAAPAAAQATLAYTTHAFHPHVVVAQDNGKGAKPIGAGGNAKVSPDGKLVAFERETKGKGGPEMKLYDVATGKTKTLFSPWRETYTFAWSPDSTMVAALGGGELGKRTLYVVDVESGKQAGRAAVRRARSSFPVRRRSIRRPARRASCDRAPPAALPCRCLRRRRRAASGSPWCRRGSRWRPQAAPEARRGRGGLRGLSCRPSDQPPQDGEKPPLTSTFGLPPL
ncbi:MAG TPA: hypothetical protein VHA80_08665 [Solirubrobacterales bacterium]|nr:hypothetical protein [Solirubrobacterales bacterium]